MTRDPPQSLAEMQDMTADEFREVDRYLYGDSLSPKRLIQHMVELAAEELTWRGESEANSLRDFWYNPTKPILQTAFPGKLADDDYRFSRRMSQNLSDAVSEMVKEGRIEYRDINVLDESRDRRVNQDTIESDKIIFVEKEAAYRKLRPLEEAYDLSIVSGGGWQATALIEDLRYNLSRSDGPFTVFLLTDYDPTGFRIASDFADRARSMGIQIESAERIGIGPDWLDPDTLETQAFEPAVNSDWDREWMRDNAIDGQYGLEIEALGDLDSKGEDLREAVVERIRHTIDEEAHQAKAVRQSTASVGSQATERIVEPLRTALKERAAEILAEQDGVSDAYENHGIIKVVSGNDIIKSESSLVANPPDAEKLHRKARTGRGLFSGKKRGATDEMQDLLIEAIEEGEIDLAELVEGAQDDDQPDD